MLKKLGWIITERLRKIGLSGMEKIIYKEEWRPVMGWEGYYEVSNLGRVRSLDREINGYVKSGRILKPQDNGHSYLNVGLHAPNKIDKHAYVHILVATAFIPNPDKLEEVNHKDFNKQNNSIENLEWVTRRDNQLHYRKSKRAKLVMQQRTEKKHSEWVQRILDNRTEIRRLFHEGYSIKEIAKATSCGKDFVTEVLTLYDEAF